VEAPGYQKYLDKQEEINLAIKKAFQKAGIEMAYPTRTLHISRE
jgi:small-conductance mechanosensitive channel